MCIYIYKYVYTYIYIEIYIYIYVYIPTTLYVLYCFEVHIYVYITHIDRLILYYIKFEIHTYIYIYSYLYTCTSRDHCVYTHTRRAGTWEAGRLARRTAGGGRRAGGWRASGRALGRTGERNVSRRVRAAESGTPPETCDKSL